MRWGGSAKRGAGKGEADEDERKVGKETGRKRERWDVVVRNWGGGHLCLTSLHSITIIHALKLAWRTVQVSLGVSTNRNIPLATSTHTHWSIIPHTAHNDWLFWGWLKAVTPGAKVRPEGQSFYKQNLWKVDDETCELTLLLPGCHPSANLTRHGKTLYELFGNDESCVKKESLLW